MASDSKMKLNNWLQSRYGNTKHLKWEDFQLGPEHAGQWIAIALFDNVEYGRGTGHTKLDAENEASERVLGVLCGY